MISLKEIARKSGVSISTVSSVLNGKEKERRINVAVAARIKSIALEEGYQPNQVAVSLRTGKSKIIGLIVDNISGSFFSSLANTIEKELEHYGYTVLYCSLGNNMSKVESLFKMLYQHNVDGYLIIPADGMEKDLALLTRHKKPVVLMDSYFPGTGLPYVLVNNYEGVTIGMRYLLEEGYRNIAFVCNDVSLIQMSERKRAYMESIQTAQLPLINDHILVTTYGAEKEQLVKSIKTFLKKNRPDAVLFAANYLGICGLESIKKLGWQIPGDIALVCFDDHELFSIYTPEITTIQQPVENIARQAVHLLMGEMGIEEKSMDRQVQISGRLIKRQSV